jgi:hypothetical protein
MQSKRCVKKFCQTKKSPHHHSGQLECKFWWVRVRVVKSIYNALQKKNTNKTKSGQKWEQKLDMICSNSKWKTICTIPFTSTQDTNIRWFQFRIVHMILATNVYLSKIGLTSDKLCTFCIQHDETISHLFWKCQSVQLNLFGTHLNFGYSKKLDKRLCSRKKMFYSVFLQTLNQY